MNKTNFIEEVSKRSMITKEMVELIYQISSKLIEEQLIKDEMIEIPDIGFFVIKKKNAKNLFHRDDIKTNQFCTYPVFQINSELKKRVKHNLKKDL